LALIEDHDKRVVSGVEAPFHITMLENEKRIAAEEKAAL
jgi:hypothetical protein